MFISSCKMVFLFRGNVQQKCWAINDLLVIFYYHMYCIRVVFILSTVLCSLARSGSDRHKDLYVWPDDEVEQYEISICCEVCSIGMEYLGAVPPVSYSTSPVGVIMKQSRSILQRCY